MFADFMPAKQLLPPHFNYRNNSVNFTNLQALEEKIASLKPPPWPFALDQGLVDKGRVLFARTLRELPRGEADTARGPVADAGQGRRRPIRRCIRTPCAARTTACSRARCRRTRRDRSSATSGPTSRLLATTVVGAVFGDAIPPLPRLPDLNSGVWLAIKKDLSVLFHGQREGPEPDLASRTIGARKCARPCREQARQPVQGAGRAERL